MKAPGILAWIALGGLLGGFLFWNFSGLPKQEGYLAMMSVFVGGPIGAAAGAVFAVRRIGKLSEQVAKTFVGFSVLAALLLFFALIALPQLK
jgi:hypothetical protein